MTVLKVWLECSEVQVWLECSEVHVWLECSATVEIGIHQALLIIIQFFTNVFVFHTTKTVGKLLRSPLSAAVLVV